MAVTIKTASGPSIKPYIPELARLRIKIFRSFPYLYDGDMAYEKKYLATYLRSDESVMVIVMDDNKVVGASSAMPMDLVTDEVKWPFTQAGIDPGQVFHLGESVLEEAYRGYGLGHVFFDERERYARDIGRFNLAAFCAVQRPENHPRKPPAYTSLDAFWTGRGYTPRPDLMTHFSWKDLGEDQESEKPMLFWVKSLC